MVYKKAFDKEAGKQYPAFRVYPFFHHQEKMPWASASVVELSKCDKLIFLSGETGRDPEKDRQPKNWEEERRGVGVVVGGIKEQTRSAWMRIKEIIEGLGARLEDIVFIRYYLVDRDDWWDMFETSDRFFKEFCPDLSENPRASTLLKGIKLDLPDMRIEIEVIAATPKK